MSESPPLAEFQEFRARMNDLILGQGNLTINRFFALDSRAYQPGALGTKTKELMGLVASLVLRCDDCVTYHVVRCAEEGVTDEEFLEGVLGRAGGGGQHRDSASAASHGAAGGNQGVGLMSAECRMQNAEGLLGRHPERTKDPIVPVWTRSFAVAQDDGPVNPSAFCTLHSAF